MINVKSKWSIWALTAISVFFISSSLQADDKEMLEIFAADGDNLVINPEHLGIINGKATVGTNYAFVGSIDGLWAPPLVSSDFFIEARIFGERIPTDKYHWLPYANKCEGKLKGIKATSVTTLIYGVRGGVLALTLKNTGLRTKEIPLQFIANGPFTYKNTLNYVKNWEFQQARSRSPVTNVADADGKGVVRVREDHAVAIGGDLEGLQWEEPTRRFHGTVTLGALQEKTCYLVFAIEEKGKAVEIRDAILSDPAKHIAQSKEKYISEVKHIFDRLPRLESSNKDFEKLYNRSLAPLLMNKWDVPDFKLNPYYSTGSVKGGCTCDYLWNFGEVWEIIPLLDPEAAKEHISHFLRIDMTKHFAFYPITGEPFGPWYMVNQEKIIGLTYYYVKITGDVAFLGEVIKDGKTTLDLMVENAMHLDDKSKAVELTNFGQYCDHHLELRRQYKYNYIAPDLNGRRYNNYVFVAELCDMAGKPAPYLRERAEGLKKLLREKLWDPKINWFHFDDGKGNQNTRYTVQMFKLFDSGVIDSDQEAGLISHLNEKEFFSEYGLHSMSKLDIAYDQVDIDNGGGGICTCFPPQIAERLYKAGKPEVADEIINRIMWWGQKMPYWGDSLVANAIDYRKDTPLQCTLDSATVAQCIYFGLFGIDVDKDGNVIVDPRPTGLADEISLKGFKIRGLSMDITVDGDEYRVVCGNQKIKASIGQASIVKVMGR